MWACFNKTCPCLPFRGESKPPFNFSYANDDLWFETDGFEPLLAQDPESILTRLPFASSQGYRGVNNMVTPNEEASASTVDEDNLQIQDAQFLPDEQISKFTELISSGQVKYNQVTDEQLAAEEEEARRLEEEEYERKRRKATEAALSKGLITPDQAALNNKNIFTIDDYYDDVTDSSRTVYSTNLDGGSSVELSTTASQRNASTDEEEQNISSLNKPRNPHQRFVASDISEDDYDDVTDFDESSNYDRRSSNTLFGRRYSRLSILRDNESKMEDYSPFSVSILPDDYELSHEDYSPTVGDEEIDHPFANILPDFSERLDSFFNGLTNSIIIKGKNKLTDKDEGNKEIINQNNSNNQEINNNKKKMVTFTVEPESRIEPSSPISFNFAFGGGSSISGRKGLRKLVNGVSNSSRSSTEVNG